VYSENRPTLGKVALFVPSLCGGGAEKVTVTLANEFAKRNIRVDLLLAHAHGPYLKDVSSAVRVVDFTCARVVACIPQLVRYFATHRPACLLSALNHANVAAAMARRISGSRSRLILAEHTTPLTMRVSRFSGHVVKRLLGVAYRSADSVIAVSHGVASDLRRLNIPPEKIAVIYNPIVSDDLLLQARSGCSHPWFQQGKPPVVIAVGRLEATKDFALLIQAFARVRKSREARLMILGEGPARPELETLIATLKLQDCVDLPGFVANPYSFIRRASLFVSSSRREGFGNVIVEALACGVPIVSTNCPGPCEILCDGKWGTIVPVGDVEALAKAVDAILQRPVLFQKHSIERSKAFGVTRAVDKYLNRLLAHNAEGEPAAST
jgi:glycosyltransferase involved in cell wall biosynthesis